MRRIRRGCGVLRSRWRTECLALNGNLLVIPNANILLTVFVGVVTINYVYVIYPRVNMRNTGVPLICEIERQELPKQPPDYEIQLSVH